MTTVLRRATKGIGGRSLRQRKIEGFGFAGLWVSVYVFQGALLHAKVSNSVVYGIYPATAPFIFVGCAAAISAATREDWVKVFAAVPVVLIAIGASFAGPVLVWLIVGIGLGTLLLVFATAQLIQRRPRSETNVG